MIDQLAASAPLVWRLVRDPLAGWRDDDPDAMLRCSVNGCVIRNGDHYAVSGIKVACLPCTELPPPTPDPVEAPNARSGGNARANQRLSPPAQHRTQRASWETRTCARAGCEETFTVRPSQPQACCSKRCARIHQRDQQGSNATAPIAEERVLLVAEDAPCPPSSPLAVVWPLAHGADCPCFGCSDRAEGRAS